MIAAGLLLRSFGRLLEVNPGFDAKNVLLARIWLPVPNNPEKDPYRDPVKRAGFMKEVLGKARALPGVHYAAISSGNGVPLLGPHNTNGFTIEEQASTDSTQPSAQGSAVSPEFFNALRVPLVRGRVFTSGDDQNTPNVVIVDDALASRYFGNQDPIGHRIKPGGRASTRTMGHCRWGCGKHEIGWLRSTRSATRLLSDFSTTGLCDGCLSANWSRSNDPGEVVERAGSGS